MSGKSDQTQRSLAELRNSTRQRIQSIGDSASMAPQDLKALRSELVEYHDLLSQREQGLQSTVVSLVDDMSQTSQILTETGTRLETIFEAVGDIAFVVVQDELPGPIIEFSAGAEHIFGCSKTAAIGQDFTMFCPDDADLPEGDPRVCAMENSIDSRIHMRRVTGEIFPALYSAYPLKNNLGETTATLIIVLDVSKQEMTDRLIRETGARYKGLAQASPVSIITFDADGTINFVNDWHMRKLDQGRMSPEYYIGKKVWEIPGVVRAGVAESVKPVLQGAEISLEDVYVPPFGGREEAWHNIRLSPLWQDDELFGGIIIREDVTRRKRTELDLKMLIDSSPIPLLKVALTEHGGVIRSLNPEATAMFGPGALNKPVDNYITPAEEEAPDLAAMRGDLCEVRTQAGPRQAIRTAHRPSGDFEVQAVLDVGVLIEAKEAAETAYQVKSDFIANISHEIRTPLNVLLGMLQLLEEADLGEEMNEMTEYASGAGKSLLVLLNDILDFTVVEARALALDEQEFQFRQVVDVVTTPYRVEAASKGVTLETSISPDIPDMLFGDARRLRQILFHVVGNGVKFTDHGSVTVQASLGESEKEDRVRLLVSVTDTGIGMSEAQVAHIFEPFRQADGSRKRRHGGTGIGLALVQEFVSLMGGKIDVSSVPGEGTRFRFTVELGVSV